MTSPWLKNYVLHELGSEIRKEGGLLPLSQPKQVWQKNKLGQQQQKQKSSTTRLVRIISRGQGGRIETGNNGVYVEGGNEWWAVHRRGMSPNLEMNANAWLWVSDGSSSIKVQLTIQSLRQIYDCDNENNTIIGNNHDDNRNRYNNDCFFGRGCCILLQKYSVEYDPFHLASSSSSNHNNNDGNSNDFSDNVDSDTILANISNVDTNRYPIQLKVSSLEAKPSLNNHTMTNNTNIRPVLEDIDVLYAVQYLTRQQQIQQQGNDDNNNDSSSSTKRKRNIARDWDIAFGRLSKGSFVATISSNDGDDTCDTDTTAADNASPGRNKNTNIDGAKMIVRRTLQQITDLVEKASTTGEAIQAWEMAKNDYGIGGGGGGGGDRNDIGNGIFNNSMNKTMTIRTNNNYNTTATAMNLPDRYDDGVDEEEDHSRMYIQNVLATQEDEDNDEEDEEPLFLETRVESTATAPNASIATSYIPPHIKAKVILDKRSSVTEIATIKQKSNNESTNFNKMMKKETERIMQTQPFDNGDIYEAVGMDLTTTTRYKRQQANGTNSPSMLKCTKQYPHKHHSLQEKEYEYEYEYEHEQEEEKEESTNSIWESVKEQCVDETRRFLHFVPSWRLVGNNSDVPATPKERMISVNKNVNNNCTNTDKVSVGSIDTNCTISSPSPSSGTYYKKYGLARWLKNYTIDNNDAGFVNCMQN